MRIRGLAARRGHSRILAPGEPSKRVGLALVAVGLLIFFGARYDSFLTSSNLITIALNVSSIAIAAVGTSALLISGNVDLSIGSQYALIAVVTAIAVRDVGDPVFGVFVAVSLGFVLGLINGVLVRTLGISPLIVTLGTLAIYRGLAYVFSGGVSVFGFPDSFVAIGRTRVSGIPIPVIVAAAVFLVGYVAIIWTVSGLRLYAIGGNRAAAALVGVKVDRQVTCTYGLNGALIGVVAVLATAKLGSGTPSLGLQFELDVLTAVILGGVAFTGGVGHPVGVLTGVVTIGILNAGLIFAGLQDWYQQIAKGSLLLVALAADQALQWRKRRVGVPAADARREPEDAPVGRQPYRGLDALVAAVPAPMGHQPPSDRDIVFTCTGLQKAFGSIVAVRDVAFSVSSGQVVCIVGDNGAGKSTLIRLISGADRPDTGTMTFAGRAFRPESPSDARNQGIETVHQDLALCPNLGVAHNVVLGEEPTRRFGFFRVRDDSAAQREAHTRLRQLKVELPGYRMPVRQLSGGQRQAVAIARVLESDVRLVILDEPTAALGVAQTRVTLSLARTIANQGAGVLLITHDIETVFSVADRVLVLRLGSLALDAPVSSVTELHLVQLMAGLTPDDLPSATEGDPS